MLENLFVAIGDWFNNLGARAGAPYWGDLLELVWILVAILVFLGLGVAMLVLLERRVAAFIQVRYGPNRVGPQGILQTIADMVKLLGKEIIIPRAADKVLFLLAPVLVVVPVVMLFAVVPFGKDMVPIDMNIGLFYFISVASLTTIIVWMGGWASNNKYSLVGAMRVVSQMVSYEIPLVLSLLGVVMLVGSLKISDIVRAQEHVWFIFTQPVAFLIYVVAACAEVKRVPFDLVEGESEIIAGPYTEYGGMAYALFMLAEYGELILISALATTCFLGGWLAPFGLTFIPSWVWFFLKLNLMILFFMWLRWTYPRIRVDQLMHFGWKVLVPLSLANIFITGIGMYVYRALGW